LFDVLLPFTYDPADDSKRDNIRDRESRQGYVPDAVSDTTFDRVLVLGETRMGKLLFKTVVLSMSLTVCAAAQVESEIAIQPYNAYSDDLDGSAKFEYGQLLVHRFFDVETEETVQQVPLFSLHDEGLHHIRKEGKGTFEARAKCVAERLELAWHLLDKGGKLVKDMDQWEDWRIHTENRPDYDPAPKAYPAIYLEHETLVPRLRIMTVYDKDVEGYPRIFSEEQLADYLIALIQAHHLLISQKSSDIQEYETLRMDRTREGRIFKEVFIRAEEVKSLKGSLEIDSQILQDALARISMPQRERLWNLAVKAPVDVKSVFDN
jgi:hypothetical protein